LQCHLFFLFMRVLVFGPTLYLRLQGIHTKIHIWLCSISKLKKRVLIKRNNILQFIMEISKDGGGGGGKWREVDLSKLSEESSGDLILNGGKGEWRWSFQPPFFWSKVLPLILKNSTLSSVIHPLALLRLKKILITYNIYYLPFFSPCVKNFRAPFILPWLSMFETINSRSYVVEGLLGLYINSNSIWVLQMLLWSVEISRDKLNASHMRTLSSKPRSEGEYYYFPRNVNFEDPHFAYLQSSFSFIYRALPHMHRAYH